ncbi:MAG: hypothetical protein JST23_08885 [Bacteroidetes bacterium]|nr:hypothetical protein [Bacteroidota bacterium]
MSKTAKKILKEEYTRLKNALKKMLKPERKEPMPQLVLQPVRNKTYK